MNALYYAVRRNTQRDERDLAHERDLRTQAREQLRLDIEEESAVPYEPVPLDEYEF